MTIVKELNDLSEKVVGTNPKATTDAQAVKYIADNYQGGGGSYVLPKASADTLGGVKVGSNLSIDANGVLSALGGGGGGIATNDYELIDVTNPQTGTTTTYKVFTLADHDPGWYAFTMKFDGNDSIPVFFRGTKNNAFLPSGSSAVYSDLEFLLYIPKKYSELENNEPAAFIYRLRPKYTSRSSIYVQSGYVALLRITAMPDTTTGIVYSAQGTDTNIGYAGTASAGTIIVGDGLSIDANGVLSVAGASSQYTLDLGYALGEYDDSNRFTYTFDDIDVVYELLDALWDANAHHKTPIATYDGAYYSVSKSTYNEDGSSATGDFYMAFPYYVDYSTGEITILHINGHLDDSSTSNSKIEIMKQEIQIPANQSNN